MKAEVVALHRSGHLKNKFEMSAGMGFGCTEAPHHGQLCSLCFDHLWGCFERYASPLHGLASQVVPFVEQAAATGLERTVTVPAFFVRSRPGAVVGSLGGQTFNFHIIQRYAALSQSAG